MRIMITIITHYSSINRKNSLDDVRSDYSKDDLSVAIVVNTISISQQTIIDDVELIYKSKTITYSSSTVESFLFSLMDSEVLVAGFFDHKNKVNDFIDLMEKQVVVEKISVVSGVIVVVVGVGISFVGHYMLMNMMILLCVGIRFRRRSSSAVQLRSTTYAGPTFNNSPAPSALPIPSFSPATTPTLISATPSSSSSSSIGSHEVSLEQQSKDLLHLLSCPPQKEEVVLARDLETDYTLSEIQRGLRSMLRI
ncbi:hypothetical protein K501DRAFT_270859 [Backusella circina FSU 941]|nr:hypothetical protein K501DRAFT_270859 [Backusella circina FSU 941]